MNEYEHLTKTTNILQVLVIIFIILAVAALVCAIIFFIKYRIPKVILELSGKQKQKQIEKMQADNSMTHSNSFQFDISESYEAEKPHKPNNNGTIHKNAGSYQKRRETGLAKNERKTALMEKRTTSESKKRVHQTVAIERSREILPDLKVIDQIVLITSKEVIE